MAGAYRGRAALLHGYGRAGPVLAFKPEQERPSTWRWTPMRPTDGDGDALYEAALHTLDELEALRGLDARHTNQGPVASGALRKGAA